MASSSSDSDRPDAKDQQRNPFVAFRRFADSQMSSLMNNVFGIFESSPIRRQQAIDEYESMLRKSRGMSQDQPRSQFTVNPEPQHEEHYKQNQNDSFSQTQTDHDSNALMRDEWSMEDNELPYGDDDQYLRGGKRYINPPRPGANNPGVGDLVPRMPIFGLTYLFTSPYSPLNLEQEESFVQQSGHLRAAFADLLAYQEGQTLLSDNTAKLNAQMTPSDWLADMTGMLIFGRGERGFGWGNFHPQQFHQLMMASELRDRIDAQRYEECPRSMTDHEALDWDKLDFCNLARRVFGMDSEFEEVAQDIQSAPFIEKRNAFWKGIGDEFGMDRRNQIYRHMTGTEYEEQEATGNNNDEAPSSELDLYHVLGEAQVEGKESTATKVEEQAKINSKPSILSTLTTTEQRTLPDGSITTKVVLKKRFSDGVEEVTENVHTQNAPQPQKSIITESSKKQEPASKKSKDEKRSGWFWS